MIKGGDPSKNGNSYGVVVTDFMLIRCLQHPAEKKNHVVNGSFIFDFKGKRWTPTKNLYGWSYRGSPMLEIGLG